MTALKDQMGLRINEFKYMGLLKNPIFKGFFTKNHYIYSGELPISGGLGQCADLKGA